MIENYAKQSVLDCIGNTPIVHLKYFSEKYGHEIYAKMEHLNPGGSYKDRAAFGMLQKAVSDGRLQPGGLIVEATSGNTGIGIAMWASVHGYRCIFTICDKHSQEKIDLLRAYGAEVVICDSTLPTSHPNSYHHTAERIANEHPGSFYLHQHDNPDNSQTHKLTTGPELMAQTKGEFDVFVAAAGTGGMLCGTSSYLKSVAPNIQTLGIEPVGSVFGHYAKTGKLKDESSYLVEGAGLDYISANYNFDVVDHWVEVQDQDAFSTARELLKREGIFCGGSTGMVLYGIKKFLEQLSEQDTDKKLRIIMMTCDTGARYQSKVFNDQWLKSKGFEA